MPFSTVLQVKYFFILAWVMRDLQHAPPYPVILLRFNVMLGFHNILDVCSWNRDRILANVLLSPLTEIAVC